MKLEEGMYVRTDIGEITKIVDRNMFDKTLYKDVQGAKYYLEEIEKASHNIINLIEVGDYVNGSKVKYICNAYIELDHYGDDFINHYESEKIKSIVTKEQFESMSYRVEE